MRGSAFRFHIPRNLAVRPMNWLAHVFLSPHDTDFRLGNLLADLVRGEARIGMPEQFLRGAACHKAIDAFTDTDAVVLRSRARIDPQFRRFAGVLIDIFYDYLLAQRWSRYCDLPLEDFTAAFYRNARGRPIELPHDARATLDRILTHDLLGQYARIEGVENSLRRVSAHIRKRWRRDYALERSVDELQRLDTELGADFDDFFPRLQQHVARLVL